MDYYDDSYIEMLYMDTLGSYNIKNLKNEFTKIGIISICKIKYKYTESYER